MMLHARNFVSRPMDGLQCDGRWLAYVAVLPDTGVAFRLLIHKRCPLHRRLQQMPHCHSKMARHAAIFGSDSPHFRWTVEVSYSLPGSYPPTTTILELGTRRRTSTAISTEAQECYLQLLTESCSQKVMHKPR